MKKHVSKIWILSIIMVMSFSGFSANAESTVYVFCKSLANSDASLSINGEDVCDLNGPVKKTIKADRWNELQRDYIVNDNCYRKITINSEGKVIISATVDFTNSKNLKQSRSLCEIQLNLTPGSVHYIQLTNKGWTDVQFKELNEKSANKLFKKYTELSEITHENREY